MGEFRKKELKTENNNLKFMKKVIIAYLVGLFTGCLILDYYEACVTGVMLTTLSCLILVCSVLALYLKNI